MAYEINPNDERLVAVNKEEEQALNKSNTLYNSMIADSDQFYQAQINAAKEWEATQKANQQAQTDFAIEKIEQQKVQATKDYTKEQSGAYVDWQKESNRYGAGAEELAVSGMLNTGYGESSQVRMYNTYQNRVATARESYNQAILNYNNAIKDAQLQNNSILAEIAYNALQQQLEFSLQGFQYKNQLLETQANKQLEIKNMYHSQYQDVLKQINTENALQEEVRQFNEELARQKAKDANDYKMAQAQLFEEKRQFDAAMAASKSSSSGGSSSIKKSSSSGGSSSSAGSVSKSSSSSSSSNTTKGGRTHSGGSQREVSTDYYQGSKNPDARIYGTFDNGYQPKGISGHGVLKKTRLTVTLDTVKQYGANAGQAVTVKQNVWEAKDGTRWYWEGRENKYKQIK